MSKTTKRVALVTGGGRGIGRGISLRLAADGFLVVVNSVSAAKAGAENSGAAVCAEISRAGGEALAIRADISQAAQRAKLLAQVRDRLGRLDLLVNNAGVTSLERTDIMEAGEESFDHVMNINLKGPYFLTQLAAKWMIELQQAGKISKGRICFITSVSAYAGSRGRGDYCISKAGLSMAAALWAERLGEFDMPVLEIRPGVIATDMTAGAKAKYDAMIEAGVFPQRRWGKPEDVAAVVAAFARGDLDYSTGVAVDASGGFQLRRL